MGESNLDTLDRKNIEAKDEPEQVWISVRDAVELICKENPKLHHLGDLITSIQRYGFQEVAKYDATLGAVKAGNGRIEALALMEKDGYDVPRGIGVDKDTGAWAMPMTIGVDAKSKSEALAYLTDSNNLVMAGGDLDAFDMMRVWDNEYVDLLTGLDELPVSVDGDILDMLTSMQDLEDFIEPDDEPEQAHKTLREQFIVPPFSVLDARQGYWQERKRAWLALGIQSELGRGEAYPGGSLRDAATLGPDGRTVRGDGHGRPITQRERERERVSAQDGDAQRSDAAQAKIRKRGGKARVFGQDLMRGEHTVGG